MNEDAALYRRLWRWHFWAALLVIPFVLWQSVTGTLYVWHQAWLETAHPELRFVTPRNDFSTLDEQVRAARLRHAGATLTSVISPGDTTRSTVVLFESEAGLPFPVFVDPYDGQVLGSLSPAQWMPGWSRALHGGWPLGDAGSWLLELGACWTIVMILTGLYLWWPRGRSLAAALLPRLRRGPRLFWRDLHACVAVWFSLIVLAFLLTALPWTSFWGQQVLKPIQHALDQASPMGLQVSPPAPQPGLQPVALQAILDIALREGISDDVEISQSSPDAAVAVRNRLPRASQERQLRLDPYTGGVLSRVRWRDYEAIPRAIATGVDLHEGTYFGLPNRWFNTFVSLALIWLSISGLMSWWTRRPRGGVAPPPRVNLRWPYALTAVAIGLCLLLPLFGASVLALLGLDLASRRWRA